MAVTDKVDIIILYTQWIKFQTTLYSIIILYLINYLIGSCIIKGICLHNVYKFYYCNICHILYT